jgi:hypothetical protein
MKYQVVFAPNLEVNAGNFAANWNAEPRCREVGAAQAAIGTAKSYDPLLAEVISQVVIPVAIGIASNALYDLIKDILLKQGVRRRTQIIHQRQPDGTELLVVTIDEEM